MSVDLKHALRHDECLPNPSALTGARWGEASVDTKHSPQWIALSPQGNLPNSSIHEPPSNKMAEEPHRF